MRIVLLILALAGVAMAQPAISKEEKREGFKSLYNRRNLRQWRGDSRLWRVTNGVIVGSTDDARIEENSFLVFRKREFRDFHLKLQARLRNGNSGVQFRSEDLPDFMARGLQADIAEKAWGSLYDERGKRGTLVDGWTGKAESTVKAEEWNEVEILTRGESITIKVNGVTTAEFKDSGRASGVLALELHRGTGMKVFFRNLRIKRFPTR